MAASANAIARDALLARARRTASDWFAGLTWKGVGLIALLCLFNAVRRTGRYWDGKNPDFLEWLSQFAQATVSGLIVATPVALSVVLTWNIVSPRPWLRYPTLALAVGGSCVLGFGLMNQAETWMSLRVSETESRLDPFAVGLVRYGLLCALVAMVFTYLRLADESAARARDAERDRARFVQRMEEARLKMLQAQIEPHFLFNTLATVGELYATAPSQGERMLDDLMSYLAAALPQVRAATSTLGGELTLTSAYLSIQQIRMGRRLEFEIDVDPPLRGEPFPPLVILTLVENAIKHGLSPLPEGGRIHIRAWHAQGTLTVQVRDSGCGFSQSSGSGTGLANIRARLAAIYGDSGQLTFTRNSPQGLVAMIQIPSSTASP